MDLTRAVTYRGLNINSVSSDAGTRVLRGIAIEDVNYSQVEANGYIEKRAGSDGMHASDVYLGRRMVLLSGHIYAPNAAELFDFLHLLRSVFSPTSAYTESPGDQGFLPMQFQQLTTDDQSFAGGVMDLQMLLRPFDGGPTFTINRDRLLSATPSRPSATPWSARLWAKDPRVYVWPARAADVSGAPQKVVGATGINRGDYEAPLNIQLVVGATVPPAGSKFKLDGFGVDMDITIEAQANRVYRWFGDTRVLMVQDTSQGSDAPFVLRMDLVMFNTKERKPMAPALINPPSRPFSFTYTWETVGVTLAADSRMFWYEAFA